MIKLNNPDHQEAKTFSQEELGNIVNVINIQFKDNPEALPMLQRLIDDYNHKVYFYEAVGGWEGLAKLQEIAGSRQWISVEDRTPNEQQEVLVLVDEEVFTAYYHGKLDGEDDWVIQGFIGSREINKVTHWQTLPELPKE